jgi:peptidoglycan/xylan/chitin deacetylase (PgdA/CDA1 family)
VTSNDWNWDGPRRQGRGAERDEDLVRTVVLDSGAAPAWTLAETVTASTRDFGAGAAAAAAAGRCNDSPAASERTGRGVGRRVLFAAAGLSLVGATGYSAARRLSARSTGFAGGTPGAAPIAGQTRSSSSAASPNSPSSAPSSASAGSSSSAAETPPGDGSPSNLSSSSSSSSAGPNSSPSNTSSGSGGGAGSSQVPTQPEYYVQAGPKMIALTLDDGPSSVYTPQILELLDQYQIKATFCMIGRQVAANHSLVRGVADAGHVIVNHTWDHSDQSKLSLSGVRDQISRANDALAAVGVHPSVFRAPYGAWSSNVFQACADAQLRPLAWSVDPRDWSRPGTSAIVSNIMRNTRTGSIILEHDGGGNRLQTVAALKIVLPQLLEAGYRFTSV